METIINWITDPNDYDNQLEDNEMYLVTIQNGDRRYVDYIEYYRGEWCTPYKVIAWAKVDPYTT